MNSHADKTQENKNQSVANGFAQMEESSESAFQFEDNRPTAIAQRKAQEAANNSSKISQLRAFQEMANNSPQVKQTIQLQDIIDSPSSEEQQSVKEKENNTGLPNNLKEGVESLSGHSMDDVKVHYNSDKPAQLQAHAYAQGSEIHLGSGQEKHLPHEAWHVIQQKQGRVKPTMQMKGGVNVNDDAGLENEADVMGGKAMQFVDNRPEAIVQRKPQEIMNKSPQAKQFKLNNLVIQLVYDPDISINEDNQIFIDRMQNTVSAKTKDHRRDDMETLITLTYDNNWELHIHLNPGSESAVGHFYTPKRAGRYKVNDKALDLAKKYWGDQIMAESIAAMDDHDLGTRELMRPTRPGQNKQQAWIDDKVIHRFTGQVVRRQEKDAKDPTEKVWRDFGSPISRNESIMESIWQGNLESRYPKIPKEQIDAAEDEFVDLNKLYQSWKK